MSETYRVSMFTPHFPGTSHSFTMLSFEEADAKAAAWIVQLQAEGYMVRYTGEYKRWGRKVFDCYREHQPTWVRIKIEKE